MRPDPSDLRFFALDLWDRAYESHRVAEGYPPDDPDRYENWQTRRGEGQHNLFRTLVDRIYPFISDGEFDLFWACCQKELDCRLLVDALNGELDQTQRHFLEELGYADEICAEEYYWEATKRGELLIAAMAVVEGSGMTGVQRKAIEIAFLNVEYW